MISGFFPLFPKVGYFCKKNQGMRIALYGRPFNKPSIPVMESLLDFLDKEKIQWFIHEPYHSYLLPFIGREDASLFKNHLDLKGKADFLFSVGGDGTLLETITMVRDSGIPVLGINTGRLGFLSGTQTEGISASILALVKGHYSLEKRSLLKLESDQDLTGFGEVNYALNELTIHKKDSASMITIHTFLNGEFLNSYWADGLIISTPTGSTGYSLSCGGPIIMPQTENFVITPIAPHNLNVRPVVVSDKAVISLQVEGRSRNFLASLDSRSVTIDSSVRLAVRKGEFDVNLVRLNSEKFLTTLRNKLIWGSDVRN